MKISDYPADKWHAHKPATWPFRFAELHRPTKFRTWHGHGANPEFTEYWLPEGAQVKIVMVSRFGDVGITKDLAAENGYEARVCLSKLKEVSHPTTARE